MSLTSSVAIYFVIWWVVLFTMLPVGVRSQIEEGDIVPGSEAGAPAHPRMLRKMLYTTLISAVVFCSYLYAYKSGWFFQ